MKLLSIIVPAHNEEKLLPGCLAALAGFDCAHEIIVADAESTDVTGQIARQLGARIVGCAAGDVSVAHNAGAAAARGDWLLFIDADTEISPRLCDAIIQAIRSGRFIGGTTTVYWRPETVAVRMANMAIARGRMLAGPFVFCRADLFPGWPSEKEASTRGLWQRLTALGPLAILTQPITLKREPNRAKKQPQKT